MVISSRPPRSRTWRRRSRCEVTDRDLGPAPGPCYQRRSVGTPRTEHQGRSRCRVGRRRAGGHRGRRPGVDLRGRVVGPGPRTRHRRDGGPVLHAARYRGRLRRDVGADPARRPHAGARLDGVLVQPAGLERAVRAAARGRAAVRHAAGPRDRRLAADRVRRQAGASRTSTRSRSRCCARSCGSPRSRVARMVAHLAESVARVVFAALGAHGVVLDARGADPRVRVRRDHAAPPSVRAAAGVPAARGHATYVRFGLRTAASQILYQLYTNLDYPIVATTSASARTAIYSARATSSCSSR